MPEPVEVLWHNPKLAQASLKFSGCSWCLDINYFLAKQALGARTVRAPSAKV